MENLLITLLGGLKMSIIFNFPGVFTIWKYNVSHGVLILRSNKSEIRDTRVEIMFKGTRYIQLPSFFKGIEVREFVNERLTFNEDYFIGGNLLYEINFKGGNGYVIAGICCFSEDDLEHYDDGPFEFEPMGKNEQ